VVKQVFADGERFNPAWWEEHVWSAVKKA